jgi:hypothetical protein
MAVVSPDSGVHLGRLRSLDLSEANSLKIALEQAFAARVPPISLLEEFSKSQPKDRFAQSLRDVPLRRLGNVLAAQAPSVLTQAVRGRPFTAPASGIAAQSGGRLAPRMSVGYRLVAGDAFAVEVRLQHANVQSILTARKLVGDFVGDQVPIGIVSKVTAQPGIHPAALNNDPLTVGSSVGHFRGIPGTLGLFVQMGRTPGFLSCSHVLSNSGDANLGDSIHHPAPDDSPSHAEIGSLNRFIDLGDDGPLTADVAFAALNPGTRVDGNRVPTGHGWPAEGRDFEAPVDGVVPVPNQRVAKIGRSTGRTTGVISLENVGPIDIYMAQLGRNVTVEGMTEVRWFDIKRPFSDFGDSGSLVYLEDTLRPVGILVAGGVAEIGKDRIGVSYVCPVAPILKTWKLAPS